MLNLLVEKSPAGYYIAQRGRRCAKRGQNMQARLIGWERRRRHARKIEGNESMDEWVNESMGEWVNGEVGCRRNTFV
jgi:hypothetical protein